MARSAPMNSPDAEPTSKPLNLGTKGGALAPELQQLWFACLKREWSSLVVLPANPGGSSGDVARALAEIGRLQRGSGVHFLNAEKVDLGATSGLIIEMTSRVTKGELVIISLDSVLSNHAGIPVALAADAALLCIELGKTEVTSARRTLDLLGRDRILGSVTLAPSRS